MRQWLAEELEADLAASLAAVPRREARLNALRRFKYRQLLPHRLPRPAGRRRSHRDAPRSCRDLADACLAAGLAHGRSAALRRALRRAASRRTASAATGLAVIGMGKLGGDELNYSSDIDLMLRLRRRGRDRGRARGPIVQRRRTSREAVASIVGRARGGDRGGQRLPGRPPAAARGPRGRARALARRLSRLPSPTAPRSGSARRCIKARVAARATSAVAARFLDLAREFVYRPGLERAVARRGPRR